VVNGRWKRMIKPSILPVVETNIPDELKKYEKWVAWTLEWKKEEKKFAKIPKNPNTGRNAKTNDPNTWSDYDTALSVYKSGIYDGIGFVTTKSDPFLFWDLDNAYDSQYGIIEAGFDDIVRDLSSYTEISPSGSGLRIIVRGQKPLDRCRAGWVEIYDSGRYLTITGHSLISGIRERQTQINELFDIIFEIAQQNSSARISQDQNFSLTDEQMLEKAFNSKNGEKIRRLYGGDISDYGLEANLK
jgi:putative DNA primase/helicase